MGWVLGGPLGGILGFALGSVLDGAMNSEELQAELRKRAGTQSGDFEVSMLVLSAYLMKADGVVKESEKQFVQQTFVQLFGKVRANEAFKFFNEVTKQEQYSLEQVCGQIRQYMDHPSRLQLIHFLFKLASADGEVHATEIEMVHKIARLLGINNADVLSLQAMFVADTDAYYKILEIPESASNDEVKKAYRTMAKKYHPDRIQHLGEDMIKQAEEKFRKVQEAYDGICKERGIA